MKLKNIILLSFISVLIGILILFRVGTFRGSDSDILQVLNKILVGNSMIVNTSSDIELEKIKINISFSDKVVFENGIFNNNIGEHYGGPNFDVYYENKLIGRALHYNTNDWYVNEFIFVFFIDNNQPKFTFKTNGRTNGFGEGYIWISKNDTLYFEPFKPNGE